MAETYSGLNPNVTDNNNVSAEISYYVQTFTNLTWGGPLNDEYFITVPQSTHGRNTEIGVRVYESVNGSYEEVDIFVQVNASLDVTIRVSAANRFSGKITIL